MAFRRLAPCGARSSPGWTLLFALLGSPGCQDTQAPDPGPSACTDAEAYDFLHLDRFETAAHTIIWSAPDGSPGSIASAQVETIPEGPHCQSQSALVLRASGNRIQGAIVGFDQTLATDASAYAGFSFWARAIGSTKEFTLSTDDPNTSNFLPGSDCHEYTDGCGIPDPSAVVDPPCPPSSESTPPAPDQCGNAYTAKVKVTKDWRLYTIPFREFQQANQPNRVPNALLTKTGSAPGTALLTTAITRPIFRFPKNAQVELWIDDLGLYR